MPANEETNREIADRISVRRRFRLGIARGQAAAYCWRPATDGAGQCQRKGRVLLPDLGDEAFLSNAVTYAAEPGLDAGTSAPTVTHR